MKSIDKVQVKDIEKKTEPYIYVTVESYIIVIANINAFLYDAALTSKMTP